MYKPTSVALVISALLGSASFMSYAGVSTTVLENSEEPASVEACSALNVDDNVDISRNSLLRCLPGNDPLTEHQWHLMNTGQRAFARNGGVAGNDMNVWWAHRVGFTGQGVNVAVVDDGLELAHPDLEGNIRQGRSANLIAGANDPSDPSPIRRLDAHGTSVGGIIGAVSNNGLGGIGVAPEANLQGYKYLRKRYESNIPGAWYISHGKPGYTDDVRVFNQSYGRSVYQSEQYSEDFAERVLKRMSMDSNGQLGAVFVKSAGNGYNRTDYRPVDQAANLPWENSNQENYNANYWNVTVSALAAGGTRSSYSTVGSSVFLTAPGGESGRNFPAHVTTDPTGCEMGYNNHPLYFPYDGHLLHGGTPLDPTCNYNSTMNGTSSAAPNTSGAFAVMMSAFPNMHQRDIRHLLASTATQVDPNYGDLQLRYVTAAGADRTVVGLEGWEENAAGYQYSPYYGFGLIDVSAAIKAGRDNYVPLPSLEISPWINSNLENPLAIADAGANATSTTLAVESDNTVEAVQITLNANHERISDLLVELVSPSGTRSVLMSPRNSMIKERAGFRNKLMLSHKFYGESARGNWTLRITDTSKDTRYAIDLESNRRVRINNNTENGELLGWSLRILGHTEAE